jgi:hypothetical protein
MNRVRFVVGPELDEVQGRMQGIALNHIGFRAKP